MSYKVEADFIHDGNRCVVLASDMGYRCGYVGIDEDNILYGYDYNSRITKLKVSDIADNPVGKRGILSVFAMAHDATDSDIRVYYYFDVHGSVTFSGGGRESKYPVESDLWWFGFDCAHAGDGKDFALMDTRNKEVYEKLGSLSYGIIRTTEFCIDECKSLSEQLNKFKNGTIKLKHPTEKE